MALAGSAAVRLLADRVGLTEHLSTALSQRGFVPVHDRGRVLVDVATVLAAGGEAIGDIDTLRHEPVWGPVASPATVWRTLDGITPGGPWPGRWRSGPAQRPGMPAVAVPGDVHACPPGQVRFMTRTSELESRRGSSPPCLCPGWPAEQTQDFGLVGIQAGARGPNRRYAEGGEDIDFAGGTALARGVAYRCGGWLRIVAASASASAGLRGVGVISRRYITAPAKATAVRSGSR